MAAESEEDRLALLDDDEFATIAELPFGQVKVIFDSEYLPVDVFEGVIQTTVPVIFGRASDLSHLKNGDRVFVNGTAFKAAEAPQNDGTGMTLIRLKK